MKQASGLPLREKLPPSKTKVQSFSLALHWLLDDDKRFDAGSYANEVFTVLQQIEACRFPKGTVGASHVTREIFNLPRFKRIYTKDPVQGWPYLSASEVFMFRPKSERYIARLKAPSEAQRHFASAGTILLSCSGTVGRCLLVSRGLEQYFLTHDLLRIVPRVPAGYLYSFLASRFGQPLLTRKRYGATVTHLEAKHIAAIPSLWRPNLNNCPYIRASKGLTVYGMKQMNCWIKPTIFYTRNSAYPGFSRLSPHRARLQLGQ